MLLELLTLCINYLLIYFEIEQWKELPYTKREYEIQSKWYLYNIMWSIYMRYAASSIQTEERKTTIVVQTVLEW